MHSIKEQLDDFYRDYSAGFTVTPRAAKTIKNIKLTWRLFLSHYPISYLSELDEGILRKFFTWGQNERNWKPMTILTHRKNISVFILWLEKKKLIKENPLRHIPKPRQMKKVPKHHTQEDIKRIFMAVDELTENYLQRVRDKAIIGVAALAGLRRGELLNLQLSDLNFEEKTLLVQASTSKSRTERRVPISLTLYDYLQRYLVERKKYADPTNNALWISTTTFKPLTDHGLAHMVDRVRSISGVHLKLHSLRHSFGTMVYAGTHDIKAVQETMGHTELKTTLVYVNSLSQDLRNAVEMSSLNSI